MKGSVDKVLRQLVAITYEQGNNNNYYYWLAYLFKVRLEKTISLARFYFFQNLRKRKKIKKLIQSRTTCATLSSSSFLSRFSQAALNNDVIPSIPLQLQGQDEPCRFRNHLRAYLGMLFPLGNVTKPGLPKCCSLMWWQICGLWWPWTLYELGLWSLVGSAVLATFWVKGQMNCNTWPTRLWVERWVNVLFPHKNLLLLKTNKGEVWRPYALWSVKRWGR